LQEAPEKLAGGQGQLMPLVVLPVLVAEGHQAILTSNNILFLDHALV